MGLFSMLLGVSNLLGAIENGNKEKAKVRCSRREISAARFTKARVRWVQDRQGLDG